MDDKKFRGTLLLLQHKTKRDPESYYEEFLVHMNHFRAVSMASSIQTRDLNDNTIRHAIRDPKEASNQFNVISSTHSGLQHSSVHIRPSLPSVSSDQSALDTPQFHNVLYFLSQVCHCYRPEAAELAAFLYSALTTHKFVLSARTRLHFMRCFALLRARNVIPPQASLATLFGLLDVPHKPLRKAALMYAVSDLRRLHLPGARRDPAVFRQVQSFLLSVIDRDDSLSARSAVLILLDMFRRRLWEDARTVDALTRACFSRHARIVRVALRFFLCQMPKFTATLGQEKHAGASAATGSDSSEDEYDVNRGDINHRISRLRHKQKCVKNTIKRDRVLKRTLRPLNNMLDSSRMYDLRLSNSAVDPIRSSLLRDPQAFAERLFAAVQKRAERFEIRLLYLTVLARVIGEHQCLVLGLYPYLERYTEPSQLHATQILAIATSSVHNAVPLQVVYTLIKAISDHFVSDRSNPDQITIGLNTIREICKRQPLAMSATLLGDLVEYRQRRGERGVVMAARALLQLFREIKPEILAPKLRIQRGRTKFQTRPTEQSSLFFTQRSKETNEDLKTPSDPIHKPIPGLEALFSDQEDSKNNSDDSESTEEVDASLSEGDGNGNNVLWMESDVSEESCKSSISSQMVEDMDDDIWESSDDNAESIDPKRSLDDQLFGSEGLESISSEDSLLFELDSFPIDPSKKRTREGSNVFNIVSKQSEVSTGPLDAEDVATRILNDSDFARLRELKAMESSENLSGTNSSAKAEKKRQELLHNVDQGSVLSTEALEIFTESKTKRDKEAKLEAIKDKHNPMERRRKRKRGSLHATNREKQKAGKLYQMVKRSQRVAGKLKRSVDDRHEQAQAMKKRGTKFRLRRGWKA